MTDLGGDFYCDRVVAATTPCPTCHAEPGEPCVTASGRVATRSHGPRVALWQSSPEDDDDFDDEDDDEYPCADCGAETIVTEFYMVTNDVWSEASGCGPAPQFLCIGCLEQRLGRRLTPPDFTDCLLNEITRITGSDRIRARLGPLTDEGFASIAHYRGWFDPQLRIPLGEPSRTPAFQRSENGS